MAAFLKNAWYVAAWADEVGPAPAERRIIGERLVLYRTVDGSPVALEGLCPHRRLPLAMGRVEGDTLACGYHGLTFAPDGRCVAVPCQNGVPSGADLRSYPVAERYGLVWVWMGDAKRADPDAIVAIPNWGDSAWGYNRGAAMRYDCNYLLITDNLLDPSHVAWVHGSSFGDPSCADVPMQIRAGTDGMTVSRWIKDTPVAPFYRDLVPFSGNADRLQQYEVRYPAQAIIKAMFVPAGQGGGATGSDPATSFVMDSYNFITPEDDGHSRYYWFQLRNVRPGDAALSEAMSASVLAAFSEDLAVLNAVQQGMDEAGGYAVSIATDAGPLRFRHSLAQRIAAEAEAG